MRSVGFVSLFCLLAIVLAAGGRPAKAGTCLRPIGAIVSIQGQVDVQSAVDGSWRPAWMDQPLCPGDVIRTGERSRAQAALVDQPKFRIDQNTSLRLVHVPDAPRSLVDLIKGAVYFFSRYPRVLEVSTPFVNALVEGTEFLLRVDERQTLLSVFEGVIAATNNQGRLQVTAGRSVVARAGTAPQPYTLVRPRDAVQWALYYPPVMPALADRSAEPSATLAAPLRQAVRLAARGDYSGAFAAFEAVPEPTRNADYYIYRAATLLQIGRAERAQSDLENALRADPGNGEAYALRAVIAVTQNDNTRALDDARRAVEVSPSSAAAKIALSYVQQARFELKAARQTLQQAVEDEPGNALAWARLAELWLMEGRRSRAVKTARKAKHLAPRLERAQTVLGFAQLARIQIREAKESFLNAIELNSANPLPRFGLGLARIREGDLKWGRGEIEIAVALDPDNALLRSYLGKAYFEERTTDPKAYFQHLIAKLAGEEKPNLAGQQFEIAKNLDPNDPTSWFYDAIRKQSENRPVEALHDLQKSIALNDNRAVYRSRQLLDEDRAGRGASLARIYNDLGFEQLGINEATKSLSIDPSNAAAHRFLSDVYATQPRREIARVSELLQAQLLQDININPVQPSLSETNLGIVNGGGPASVGLNEFTPLFERNQAQLNTAGVVGSDYTRAGEAVVSGVYDRFSVSAGQFHYETDGFRENADLQHDIFDIFAQAALTPEVNVQAEFFSRRTEEGDLRLNFDADEFSRDRHRDLDQSTGRIGLRYAPSTNSNFITSIIYSQRNEKLQSVFAPPFSNFSFDNRIEQNNIQVESQYNFQNDIFNTNIGFTVYEIDTKTKTLLFLNDNLIQQAKRNRTIDQKTTYAYSRIKFPREVTWTIGLSYDNYDAQTNDVRALSPKLGAEWDITERMRLRLAAFKTVKPALVANRTIQPTQVSGFNQFFDEVNGTVSWRYGAGLDARLTEDLYSGVEASFRHLSEPAPSGGGKEFTESRDEQLYRAYLYWTPDQQWAVSGEFQFDVFDSEKTRGVDFLTQVDSMRVPLAVRYFNPLGFFGGLTTSYVHQDVNRQEGAGSLPEGNNSFVIVDAIAGFRFPERRGLISLEVRNLFDANFKYQDENYRVAQDRPNTSFYMPERTIFGRITFNL